jgi:hypothetical protein
MSVARFQHVGVALTLVGSLGAAPQASGVSLQSKKWIADKGWVASVAKPNDQGASGAPVAKNEIVANGVQEKGTLNLVFERALKEDCYLVFSI